MCQQAANILPVRKQLWKWGIVLAARSEPLNRCWELQGTKDDGKMHTCKRFLVRKLFRLYKVWCVQSARKMCAIRSFQFHYTCAGHPKIKNPQSLSIHSDLSTQCLSFLSWDAAMCTLPTIADLHRNVQRSKKAEHGERPEKPVSTWSPSAHPNSGAAPDLPKIQYAAAWDFFDDGVFDVLRLHTLKRPNLPGRHHKPLFHPTLNGCSLGGGHHLCKAKVLW